MPLHDVVSAISQCCRALRAAVYFQIARLHGATSSKPFGSGKTGMTTRAPSNVCCCEDLAHLQPKQMLCDLLYTHRLVGSWETSETSDPVLLQDPEQLSTQQLVPQRSDFQRFPIHSPNGRTVYPTLRHPKPNPKP